MNDFPWLSLLIALPLVGAVVTAFLPNTSALPKQVATAVAALTFVLSLVVAFDFESDKGMQFVELHDWIPLFGAHYAVGVDGIGLTLVLLTTLLVPVVVLASWNDADDSSPSAFFAWMLALEGLALAVFTAQDVFLFYVAFEATLIPAYFLIGSFGHVDRAQRSKAAVKFLLYMLAGGLIMLASVVGLYAVSAQAGEPSYLIGDLAGLDMDKETGRWLFLGFFIAFAIKAPLFPVHTWLPDTTAAATPGTSVLLICVLDKIGTYGMLRLCLGLFPEASKWATPVVIVLAVISIIYGALLAIGQDDMLKLIGLTSLSHFGFIVLGVFVMNTQGMSGATFYMFNHGLATAVMFLVAGYLIRRRGSRLISDHGGIEKVAPVLAGLFLVGGLGTLGLPGLSPFVSEFLVLVGGFAHHWVTGAFAVTGIVLAAIYVLWMYQKLMTGPTPPEAAGMSDLNVREIGAVAPLVAAMLLFGFYPKPVMDIINPAVESTMVHVGVTDDEPDVVAPDDTHDEEGHQ